MSLATYALFILLGQTASEANKAFDDGKAAMKANDIARACALFEKSLNLEPALGTLLNLATCLERQGKIGSAWLRFNEAAAWASRTHEAKREEFANEQSRALKPRVSWISFSSASAAEVKVDGVSVKVTPAIPVAVPADIGTHVVRRELPGFAPWSAKVQIEKEGVTTNVSVAELVPADVPQSAPPLVGAAPVSPSVELTPSSPSTPGVSAPVNPPSKSPGVALIASGAAVAVAGIVGLVWSLVTYGVLQAQKAAMTPVSMNELQTLGTVYPASYVALGVGAATAIIGVIVLMARGPNASAQPAPLAFLF